MGKLYHQSYFFDQGVRFECRRCGACCTGDPGTIYVDRDEISRIDEYLSVRVSVFIDAHLFPIKQGHSIREHSDGRCLFYDSGCTIYSVRPNQCRTFPFWFENLRSLKNWRRTSKECPGIGFGSRYSKVQILDIVRSNMDAVIKSHLTDNHKYRSSMTP